MIDFYSTLSAKEDVDLIQFILDLASVTARQQNEKIQRVIVELKFVPFRPPPDDFGRFFFPSAPTGIEAIENLQFGAFGERFVKRAPFIHRCGTQQERHVRSEVTTDHFAKLIKSGLNAGCAANYVVAEKIRILQPDQFCAAQERQRLQCFDCRSYPCRRLFRVIDRAIDYFLSKVARL